MLALFRRIFNDSSPDLRAKIIGIYSFLFVANVGAWVYALIAFHNRPVLLGTALLAYGFGLRHAVDADHIAAIDNVTRKLMQERKQPAAVGFFFSLGHSLVLVIGTALISITVMKLQSSFNSFNNTAGIIGTSISATFLLAMAFMNLMIAHSVFRTFRHVRRGGTYVDEDLDILLANRGFLARMLRPVFRMVTKSWHMFPVGFLFGLGFDTATEVSLLTVAATEAGHGLSPWSIMAFPALFAVGMSLIDTTDGVLMLGAYGWAFVKPIRKLYYNLIITIVSALVALVIGGIETLGLVASELNLGGAFWGWIGKINDNFGTLGYVIIGIFAVAWIVSTAIYRSQKLDDTPVSFAEEQIPAAEIKAEIAEMRAER